MLYASGEERDLVDWYPDLALFRDIVFIFKVCSYVAIRKGDKTAILLQEGLSLPFFI